MMTEEYVNQPRPQFAEMTPRSVAHVALLGLLLGLVAWVITAVVSNYVISPLFCKADGGNFSVCAQGGLLASNIASLIVAGLGMVAALRLGVFRPLLVALAALVTLWGLGPWLGAMPWYEALGWSSVLYALAYATFAWLARIRVFWIALLATVVVIVSARFFSSF